MSDYRRPYDDGRRIFVWCVFVVGSILMIATLLRPDPAGTSMRTSLVVFLVLWFAAGIRVLRNGLFVGEAGVRLRGLLRSRTVSWSDIQEFGGQPEGRALRLVIKTRQGREIATPVLRIPERRPAGTRYMAIVLLLPEHYEDLLKELRYELRAHQYSSEVGPPT